MSNPEKPEPKVVQQLYLRNKINLPSPTTPEASIGDFIPGPFVARAEVCSGTIESQHPNPKRAIQGLGEAYKAHTDWHLHQRQPKLCKPSYPIPLLQIFTSGKNTIIRPVSLSVDYLDPEKFRTTIFELPEEIDTLPHLYAVELPKPLPQK